MILQKNPTVKIQQKNCKHIASYRPYNNEESFQNIGRQQHVFSFPFDTKYCTKYNSS